MHKYKKTFSLILVLIGILYLVISFLPLVKSLLKKTNTSHTEKEDWVEVPFTIEE